MGLFSGMQAAGAIRRLKKGGTASLSYSQVANLIIDLFAAKNLLPKQQFDAVYALYRTYQADKVKVRVDNAGYEEMAMQVLKRLDRIAPYETYGAGHEDALRPLLEKVRAESAEEG